MYEIIQQVSRVILLFHKVLDFTDFDTIYPILSFSEIVITIHEYFLSIKSKEEKVNSINNYFMKCCFLFND